MRTRRTRRESLLWSGHIGHTSSADSCSILASSLHLVWGFPAQDIRSKQGHAFANGFSRDWSLLEEDKKCLCGYPDDQEKGAGCHSQHGERPEMMIVTLSAQGASFFHDDELTQPLRRQSTVAAPPGYFVKNGRARGRVRMLIRDDKYSENTIRHSWDI
jgi:hypothetical protein